MHTHPGSAPSSHTDRSCRPSAAHAAHAARRALRALPILIGTAAPALAASALPEDRTWVDHPYDRIVNAMAPAGGTLLIATHGGGVIAWDTRTGTYRSHTRNNSGLPANFVTDVAFDDAAGDVWAATERGLARLPGGAPDGTAWEIIHAPGTGPVAGMLMTAVVVDHANVTWAGSYDDGLFRYERGAWTSFLPGSSPLSDRFVTSLAVGPSNELWIGVWGDGVDLLRDGSWSNHAPWNTGTPGGCSEILSLPPEDLGLVSVFADVLAVHPVTGETWFLNDDDGWCILEGATRFSGEHDIGDDAWSTFTDMNSALPGNSVTSAGFDAQGSAWLGTHTGVARFDGTTVHHVLPSLPSVLAIQRVDDDLWFGTWDGMARYDGTSLTLHATDGLLDNHVADVAQSPSGEIWIATRAGAQRYLGDGRWASFTTADGLPINDVRAIEFDAQGTAYIGTWGGGLAVYDGSSVQVLTPSDSDICCLHISRLAVADDGTVWAGSPVFSNTWALGIAPNGDVWRGMTSGAWRLSGGTWTQFTIAHGLPGNLVQAVAFEPDGSVWVGTTAGAARFDGNTWTAYTTGAGLPGNDVLSIAHDARRGETWFGVRDGGAARYDGTTFTVFNTQNGLINDRPLALLVAAGGDLWVGTDYGVSQFTAPADPGTPSPDFDGDGVVGAFDLLVLLSLWGPCPIAAPCPADLNGDSQVGTPDLLHLLSAWGPIAP